MEAKEYLRLKVDPSSDGTGKLTAEVASSGFAGRGEAYFDLQKLAHFSQELRAFPLSESNPPHIEGGFWSKEERGVLEQVHLSIRAYQIGSKGADDRSESQNIAQIELMTSYAALERFAKDLKMLLESNADEAMLRGERLS